MELELQRVLPRLHLLLVHAGGAVYLDVLGLELVLEERDLAGLVLQVLAGLDIFLVQHADLVQRPAQGQARGFHVVYGLLVKGRFVEILFHK